MKTNPTLQQALDTVESLSFDQQAMLIEIIQHRLREQRRQELLSNVAQSEKDYSEGNVHGETVDDLMAELAKVEEM